MPIVMERLSRLPGFLTLIAHGLAVLSLLAFRLRADGWVMHPVALAFYGAILVLAAAVDRRRCRAARPPGAGTAVPSDPPTHPDACAFAGVERRPMAGRGALRSL